MNGPISNFLPHKIPREMIYAKDWSVESLVYYWYWRDVFADLLFAIILAEIIIVIGGYIIWKKLHKK